MGAGVYVETERGCVWSGRAGRGVMRSFSGSLADESKPLALQPAHVAMVLFVRCGYIEHFKGVLVAGTGWKVGVA